MAIGSPQWMYSSGEYELEQSLKLDRTRNTFLNKTFASAGNRRTFTLSFWLKMCDTSTTGYIIEGGDSDSDGNRFFLRLQSDGILRLAESVGLEFSSNALLRDPSAWYHIVIAIDTTQGTDTNRIKLYINGEIQTFLSVNYPSQNYEYGINKAAVHTIGRSHIDDNNPINAYLSEFHFIDGQALTPADFGKTGTYGEWKPKEYSGTYGTNGFYLPFKQDYTVEGFSTVTYKGNGGTQYIGGTGFKPDFTWQKRRDGVDSHVLTDSIRGTDKSLYSDRTDAEASPNPVSISAFNSDGFTLGANGKTNGSGETVVAWNWDMGADTPTGFGCVTWTGDTDYSRNIKGFNFDPDLVWIKSRSDAYEFLHFDTLRGAGERLMSHNSNAESTNTSTLNRFIPDGFTLGSGSGVDLSVNGDASKTYVAWGWDMGNTTATNTTGTITSTVRANPTYGQSIISWTGTGATGTVGTGLTSDAEVVIVKNRDTIDNWSYSDTVQGGGTVRGGYLNSTAVINDTGWSSRVDPSASTANTIGVYNWDDGNKLGSNMIAYAFHSVSGYSKFGTYSGTGNLAGPSVTLGFRPAWVMIRKTNGSADWLIFDNTRNPLNEVRSFLEPNTTDVETIEQTTNYELGIDFDDNGFQIKARGGGMNSNGDTYLYMAFAGGMDSISDYNTDGSIDSRVKANTTYGQSIVSYTGNGAGSATVGHGLSSAPEMMIVRSRGSNAWAVYHTSMGNTHLMELNTTAAKADNNTFWNDTSPTSSVFTIGSHGEVNANNTGFIAYCFHSVTGYSKFGSYTGNGSSSGATVTLGFRPAFIMIKCASHSSDWRIWDNMRNNTTAGTNSPRHMLANTSAVENTTLDIRFTDTGFIPKTADGEINGSGKTYIYMTFADKREYAYWLDQSGNNNDWTSNNLTESDISVDSPTNNFATFNPLQAGDAGSIVGTISEGNLKHYLSGSGQALTMGTIAPTTGKWYCEFTMGDPSGAGSDRCAVGIGDVYDVDIQGSGNADKTVMVSTSTSNRVWLTDNVESDDNFPARTKGSIIQFAWDMDNSKVWIGIDNQWCNSSGAVIPKSDVEAGNNATVTDTGLTSVSPLNRWSAGLSITQTHWLNCGQDSSFAGTKTAQGNQDSNEIGDFYYTPPTGFLALCTKNLPDVAVTPSEHFNTVLYTGNNATSLAITGVGFQPDFLWLKRRDSGASHYLVDAVRGRSKGLLTNGTTAEYTTSDTTRDLRSFDSDGFTVGQDYYWSVNTSGATMVAWNWKAPTSSNLTATGARSIATTSKVNVDAGFEIITYTGSGTAGNTIGHSLGKAPDLMIGKNRTDNEGWWIYHNPEVNEAYKISFDTAAKVSNNTTLNNTAPTSSIITLGNDNRVNANGDNYLIYAFVSVDGYSKVGSYTGNGNADGTFVYTGFRPAFIMVKSSSATGHWEIHDTTRDVSNLSVKRLFPNYSNAEDSDGAWDILSNGFKFRTTHSSINASGASQIYIAFAETPFKYSNAR